jgi:predicted nucleic acid-binding protein
LTRFIVDSHAWIEYLLSTEAGEKVKKILENQENKIFTHIFSLAEISSRLTRAGAEYSKSISVIISDSEIIETSPEISARAGELHANMRKEIKDFGLVDAFILLAAKEMGAKILTGDPHFRHIKEAVMI